MSSKTARCRVSATSSRKAGIFSRVTQCSRQLPCSPAADSTWLSWSSKSNLFRPFEIEYKICYNVNNSVKLRPHLLVLMIISIIYCQSPMVTPGLYVTLRRNPLRILISVRVVVARSYENRTVVSPKAESCHTRNPPLRRDARHFSQWNKNFLWI